MTDNLTEKKERAVCIRCKRRRFTDEMVLVFKHPLIHPKGIYACHEKHWKYGKCIDHVRPELLMYANTGLLQLKPAAALL